MPRRRWPCDRAGEPGLRHEMDMSSILAPPLTTWVTPDKSHDQSSYCKQTICYVLGTISVSSAEQWQ